MSRGKIAFEQGPCGIISLERYTATHVFALAVSFAAALPLVFLCSRVRTKARARASALCHLLPVRTPRRDRRARTRSPLS